MSRLDDLVDLIQSANDVYLINPARNVRSAYIQIDDLCELTMKSWCQGETTARQQQCLRDIQQAGLPASARHRNAVKQYFTDGDNTNLLSGLSVIAGSSQDIILQGILTSNQPVADWSAEGIRGFKRFHELVLEVKDLRADPPHHELHLTLDRIQSRRDNRNHFFHDQNQSGLTVDGSSCLLAFLDLYRLNELLYGQDFVDRITANAVVKAQIAIINLRHRGSTASKISEPYNEVLQTSKLKLTINSPGHEYCLLHQDPSAMLRLLQAKFDELLTKLNNKISRIDALPHSTADHIRTRALCEADSNLYREIITQFLT